MIEKTESSGFDSLYEVPLTDKQIKQEIIPNMVQFKQQRARRDFLKAKLTQNYANKFLEEYEYAMAKTRIMSSDKVNSTLDPIF